MPENDDNAFDATVVVAGSEEHREYIARLSERHRKRRESHDAVQAIIDANRAQRDN